jgi:hypothetical protein
MGVWGPMGMDTAAGPKNVAGSHVLSRVINGTIERGRGCVLVPVDIMVSDLETTLMGLEVLKNWTYQE